MAAEGLLLEPLRNGFVEKFEIFQKDDQHDVINVFRAILGERYHTESLSDLLLLLEKDNRISPTNTHLLDECIGHVGSKEAQEAFSELVKGFKIKYKSEISELKKQESFRIRKEDIYNQVDLEIKNGHGLLLFGPPGVGKTFLARDYLEERKEVVKEIDLRDIKEIKVVMAEILRKFGHIVSVADVDINIFGARLSKVGSGFILFLDNADEFFISENREMKGKEDVNMNDVIKNIIHSGKGKIKLLITSRNRCKDESFDQLLRQKKIGQLEGTFAKKLLLSFKMSPKPSDKMLDEAIEICRYLPLNLALLGGMLQESDIMKHGDRRIKDILNIVKRHAHIDLKSLLGEKLEEETEIELYTDSCLKASFDKLGDTVQLGAVALSLFHRPFSVKDVEFLFNETFNSFKLNMIIHALQHHCLIFKIREKFDIHPKVRNFLQSQKDAKHISDFYQNSKCKFLDKYKSHLQEISERLHNDYDEGQILFRSDYANFEFAFEQHATDGIPLFDNYYDLQVASDLLFAMFKKEWRISFFDKLARNCFSKGDMSIGAMFLCHSAFITVEINTYDAMKVLNEAESYLETLLKGSCDHGPKQQQEIKAIKSMCVETRGFCHFEMYKNSFDIEDNNKAVKAYKMACSMMEEIDSGAKIYGLASVFSGLAACYCQLADKFSADNDVKRRKEYTKLAIENNQKSLSMYNKFPGDSIAVPRIMQNMGAAFQVNEQFNKAIDFYKNALKYEKKLKISGFHLTSTIYFNMANTFRALNKYKKALEKAKESLKLKEELFNTSANTVQGYYQIAVLYHEQSYYVDAIEWYEKAFNMEEQLPINQHSSVRKEIREWLAYVYEKAITKKKLTHLQDDFTRFKRKIEDLDKEEERMKVEEERRKLEEERGKLEETTECASEKKEESTENRSDKEQTYYVDTDLKGQTRELTDMSIGPQADESTFGNYYDAGIARMFLDSDGGRFEFKYLGITLEVPENSIDNTELQLSRVDPSDAALVWNFSLGETILSDVLLLGPAGLKFKKPSTLSIPYRLIELPEFCDVVIRFFDKEAHQWVDIPSVQCSKEIGDEKRQFAEAQIHSMTMYVVCLVLRTYRIIVPSRGLEVTPFGKHSGIKVKFEAGTFDTSSDVVCNIKVNKLTNKALERLEHLSICSSSVLHVELENTPKIRKPVKIQFCLQGNISVQGETIAYRGEKCLFKGMKKISSFEVNGNYVTFNVVRFSIFIVVRSIYTNVLEQLSSYIYPLLGVRFYLYGRHINDKKNRTVCVACSHIDDGEKVEKEFSKNNNDWIADCVFEEGVYDQTEMKISVLGMYKMDADDKAIILRFKCGKCRMTQWFPLTERDQEGPPETRNQVVINGKEDQRKYISIYFKGFHTAVGSIQHDSGPSKIQISPTDFGFPHDEIGEIDSDEEKPEDHQPLRFLGLKLEKCCLNDVVMGIDNIIQLERILDDFPEQSLQEIKPLAKDKKDIAAMKCTLQKITDWFIYSQSELDHRLNLLHELFANIFPHHTRQKMKKVMDYLAKPCRNMKKNSHYLGFIKTIYEREDVFENKNVRKIQSKSSVLIRFGLNIGFTYGDLENIERDHEESRTETQGMAENCCRCKLMLLNAMEESKVTCLLDVVKALWKTQRKYKENKKLFKRIKKLMDDLGTFVEDVLNLGVEEDDW